jgi:hypothetical protein
LSPPNLAISNARRSLAFEPEIERPASLLNLIARAAMAGASVQELLRNGAGS